MFFFTGCGREAEAPASKPQPEAAEGRVRALAHTYLQGYFDRNPAARTLDGVPGAHHDQLSDNSPDALKAWQAKEDVVSKIDCDIIYPGQATAYMPGEFEIQKMRDDAKQTMGQRFDIKGFHDRVLEDGEIPVTFLRDKIRDWSNAR